jgi:GTP-binding protein YchF
MKIAIIGLPNSGKTTVFNALTRGTAETSSFSTGRLEPNLAAVKVPDSRVDALSRIYNPKKTTYAEVQYVDIGGFEGQADKREALPSEMLNQIGNADALLHVVRSFQDAEVPHPLESINPRRDEERLEQELILSDLIVIERRLERLDKEIPKLPPKDRGTREVEHRILQRFRAGLEDGRPIRALEQPSDQEERSIRGFQFLSAKPVLPVLNVGEDRIGATPTPEEDLQIDGVIRMSARIEAELAQLESDDAAEFMQDLGIKEAARDRVIKASYRLLGLISFMTVGEDEVRAWTIHKGMKAPEAGGVIHSDIQRGFIRAEVVSFEDLVEAGSLAAAKKRGTVRLEGRDYVVRDGDISHFLFNV